jgi:molybdenum cofactor guanylyltransferase
LTASPQKAAPVFGLVLAGGAGRRIGLDKGALEFHGEPQARYARRLLLGCCAEAFVSVRAQQAAASTYAGLPLIVDKADEALGPAAGLLAACQHRPDVAWLALATDMPRVDAALLENLVAARDPGRLATAFRHADGTIEPLCTIYEPAAGAVLEARVGAGERSLRAMLAASRVAIAGQADPARLVNVNSAQDYRALRAGKEHP